MPQILNHSHSMLILSFQNHSQSFKCHSEENSWSSFTSIGTSVSELAFQYNREARGTTSLTHSIVILSFNCHSVIQLSFCHSKVIPCIIGRQGELLHFVIRLSFCHSKIIHSIIERQGDLLISVIQLSFCHSNIIPCIIGRQGELFHFVI